MLGVGQRSTHQRVFFTRWSMTGRSVFDPNRTRVKSYPVEVEELQAETYPVEIERDRVVVVLT